jgi:VWFA-related protein
VKAILATVMALALWPATQTFRVSVDAVRVDVLVTDGRNPIAGLSADNFELRDNGVVQQIESVSVEDVALSVMLAFDTSASVAGRPLEHLKEAATAVVALLTPADRAALMTFTGAMRLHTPWTTDHAALQAGIAQATASGATTLHDAAYAALTLRDSRPGRALVLIFSDGADTASWLPGKNVLDIARRNEAVVYAVALRTLPRDRGLDSWTVTDPAVAGYRLDFRSGLQDTIAAAKPEVLMEPFLEALAAETGGKVLNAERSDQLQAAFVQIVKEFRSRYLLTYTPRGVDSGGWHPIQVTLEGRKGTVTARRGYLR